MANRLYIFSLGSTFKTDVVDLGLELAFSGELFSGIWRAVLLFINLYGEGAGEGGQGQEAEFDKTQLERTVLRGSYNATNQLS